ncbi:MAG: hypothetical protein ACX936_21560, partial [Marinobacter sp.]
YLGLSMGLTQMNSNDDTTQTIFVAVIPESPILIKQIICFVAPTKRVDSDCQAFCSNSFGLLLFHHMQQFISN